MKISLLVTVVCSSASLCAETNTAVVPGGFANQAGNASDQIFFGAEIQELFRSSALPISWSGPVEITGVSFRVDENSAASLNAVIPNIQIYMSTSAQAPENLSQTYSFNRGPDETTVFSHDNVPLTGAAGQQVNPFDVRFNFDRPFTYDRTSGNLLMYMKVTGSGPGARTIDSQSLNTSLSSAPVVSVEAFPPPFGSGQVKSYSLINEFSWVSIPEPSVVSLVLVASSFWLIRQFKRAS